MIFWAIWASKETEGNADENDIEEEGNISHEESKNVMEIATKCVEEQRESTVSDDAFRN